MVSNMALTEKLELTDKKLDNVENKLEELKEQTKNQSIAMEIVIDKKKEKKAMFIVIIIICLFWLISSIISIFAFIKINSQYAELNSKYVELVRELGNYGYEETEEYTQEIQDVDTIENSYIINGGDYNG